MVEGSKNRQAHGGCRPTTQNAEQSDASAPVGGSNERYHLHALQAVCCMGRVSPSCRRVTRAVFPLPIAEGSAKLVKLAWLGVQVPSSCSQKRELGRLQGGWWSVCHLLQAAQHAVLGAAVQDWRCAHARSRHPADSTWLAGNALSDAPARWPLLDVPSADQPQLPYRFARIPYNSGCNALHSQRQLSYRKRQSHLLPGTAWPVAEAVAVFPFPVAQVQLHGGPSIPDAQRSKGPGPHILQAHHSASIGSPEFSLTAQISWIPGQEQQRQVRATIHVITSVEAIKGSLPAGAAGAAGHTFMTAGACSQQPRATHAIAALLMTERAGSGPQAAMKCRLWQPHGVVQACTMSNRP